MTKLNVGDDGRIECPPNPDHKGMFCPRADHPYAQHFDTEEKQAKRVVRWELLNCSYSWRELRDRIVEHNALSREQRSALLNRLHALAAYLGVTTDKLKREGGSSVPAGKSKVSSPSYFRKQQ